MCQNRHILVTVFVIAVNLTRKKMACAIVVQTFFCIFAIKYPKHRRENETNETMDVGRHPDLRHQFIGVVFG